MRVPEAEAKRAAVEKTAPVYPPMARQMKVTGRVVVNATVKEDGTVDDVKIETGSPILARAAVDAVKKWRFHPFQKDGTAVSAVVTLSFEFDTK